MYTNSMNSCFGNSFVPGQSQRLNQAGRADAGAPTHATTGSLSLDALNSVPQFLYGNMINALNKEFGTTGVGAASTDAAPVTFKDLVDRIKSVAAQLSSAAGGAPDDVKTRVKDALQHAVQKSKDVLNHYGKLDAGTEQQINGVVDAILAPPADSTAPAPVDANSSVVAATYASIDRSLSASIQITTREGDLVTIELSKQSGASVATAYGASGGTQVNAQQSTRYQSSQLNYSVQGDLNKDERDAIEKVLKKIDKIADKFYSGDATAAFKKASQLGFDADTLVGVSLSMNSTETTKAISAYQTVGTSSTPAAATTTAPVITGTLPDAAQFAQGVHDVVTDPAAQTALANPTQTLGKLMEAVTQLKNNTGQPGASNLADLTHALKAILDAVINLANAPVSTSVPQEPPQAIAA